MDHNPYQPPPVQEFKAPMSTEGLWRNGSILVAHKNAAFPDRCVKTNEPTERKLKRNLQWATPMIGLAILASPLIYIILYLVLRKTATLYVGVSDAAISRRRLWIAIGWFCALGVPFLAIVGGAVLEDTMQGALPMAVLFAFVAFLFGLIAGSMGARVVWPSKIDDHYAYIKGVNPEFLNELPQWPY